jgi:hypothetical protein
LGRWERMLGRYAELQVRASGHVEELLAAGEVDADSEPDALAELLDPARRREPTSQLADKTAAWRGSCSSSPRAMGSRSVSACGRT